MQKVDCPNLVVYNEIKEKVAPVVEPCISDTNDDGLIMCSPGGTGLKLCYLDIIGVLCKANLIAKYMHGSGTGFPIFSEGDLHCGPYQISIGFGGLLRGGTIVFYEG